MASITMTTSRGNTASSSAGLPAGRRARRALFLAGNIGLMLGGLVGVLRIDPALLVRWLPFPVSDRGIMLAGGALIGLMVGAAAGLALRGSSGGLRFASAAFVTMSGLMASEIVRAIGLRSDLRSVLTGESGDALAAQIALAMLGALIGSRAGHAPASVSVAPAPSRRARRRAQSAASAVPAAADAASAPQRARIVSPKPVTNSPFRKLRFRRGVHLGREKTSVCPYCLEEVKPGDRRVVCKICRTPHHADCWAITGKCEVPHLQT